MPKHTITIITVVFNACQDLKLTLESVLSQKYDNLEFIVIDGGSTDGTVDVIKRYEKYISFWVSEPDNGIYDAMNKGITHSSGKYIHFLNAGDVFTSEIVVKSIADIIPCDSNLEPIYVGGWLVKYPTGKIKYNLVNNPLDEHCYKMPLCHQSMFVPKNFLVQNKLNDSYKIAADFDCFLAARAEGIDIVILDTYLSCVTSGGVSDLKRIDTINEYQKIYESYHGKGFYTSSYYFTARVLERIKKIIKFLLFK